MSRQVSQEEVLALHQFCIRHFVSHYDVRLELVDHLASSIENIWALDPEVSFQAALEKVYASYGKTGFRKLMREKELAIENTFNKGVFKILRSFFSWPQILSLLMLIAVCRYFFEFFGQNDAYTPTVFCICFLSAAFLFCIITAIFFYKKMKSLTKPLLATSIYFDYFVLFIIDTTIISKILTFVLDGMPTDHYYSPGKYIFTVVLCIISLLTNAAKIKYVHNTFKKAEQNYPMAFK